MSVILENEGFYNDGNEYDNIGIVSPMDRIPSTSNIRKDIDSFYIRRPLDQNQKFMIFKNNAIQIVKGNTILFEFKLDTVFEHIDSYQDINISLQKAILIDVEDGEPYLVASDSVPFTNFKSALEAMNIEDQTKENNYLNFSDISFEDYSTMLILPDYSSQVENVSDFAFFIKIGDEWILGKKFMMLSTHDALTQSIIIANPLAEELSIKIILIK